MVSIKNRAKVRPYRFAETMTYLLRRVGVIAFGIVAALSIPAAVFAQTDVEGLQIKPAIIEDNVQLGGFSQYTISVTNIAQTNKTFYLSTRDIKGLDDSGNPVFEALGEVTGYELSSWIGLTTGAIDLGPGETKSLTFSVHVPAKVGPGAHFGAIFMTDRPSAGQLTGSAVSISVATVVSLKVPGDVQENAQLREFSTDKTIYGSPNVDLTAKIENLGNVFVRPQGVVTITDMFGRSVATINVNNSLAPVFPASTRKYSITWDSEDFAFGRYEAVASFAYGDVEKKTISGTTSFWVLPIKAISIVLGVLLALIIGMYAMIRLYIRRKLADMGISSESRDADYYARKYQRSGSRMIVVTLIVFLVCILFLAALFLAFA
jgi:hypothetical protein